MISFLKHKQVTMNFGPVAFDNYKSVLIGTSPDQLEALLAWVGQLTCMCDKSLITIDES